MKGKRDRDSRLDALSGHTEHAAVLELFSGENSRGCRLTPLILL